MSTKFPFGYYMADMPDDYFPALGRLQHAFTCLEVSLTGDAAQLVIANPLEVWDTRTIIALNAVLGGMRMKDAIDTVKRLHRALNVRPEIRDHADEIFRHIGDIQHFRNRLTHYQTEANTVGSVVEYYNSDLGSNREAAKAKSYKFELSAIDAATLDLLTSIGSANAIANTILGHDDCRPFERQAWRYKPSMLVEMDRQYRKNPLPLLPPH